MRLALTYLLVEAFSLGVLGFYDSSGSVISLDQNIFDKKVKLDGAVWLVEFYAPWCGHCKNLVPAWEEAASALKGIVNVAAVDADTHKSLASEFGVQGFPTIKLITAGKNGKRKVVDFKGGRTAKDIVEWALGQAKKIALNRIGITAGTEKGGNGPSGGTAPPPSSNFYGAGSDVVALTDSNFHAEVTSSDDLWLVEFYAPWCGHCKNLKPEYEQLAKQVKGKVKIGAVDCTANQATCQEFGVQGYPTIKLFPAHEKDQPSDFQGGRDSSSMADYVLAEWRKLQPPPEAKHLVDQHVFESECIGNDEQPAQKLCFIAFLTHILDSKAAGRRKYIQVLQQLAEKHAERPFSYLWAEGGAQPALEKALAVGGYGLPAFTALNPQQRKYAALREAFDVEHATEFVERLRQGFERVSSVDGSIPELETTDPWDGGEGVEFQEEEFSLEDLMREEL